MNRIPIFSAWLAPDQRTPPAADAATAISAQSAGTGADTPSVISQESLEIPDRDINIYCDENTQFNPIQELTSYDSDFGKILDTNPFLAIGFGKGRSPRGAATLQDLNQEVTEWPDELPEGLQRPPQHDQQKLFNNSASGAIKPIQSLNASSVTELKRATQHLLQCDHPGMMETFIRGKIPEEVRQQIQDSVRHMPVRGKFMLAIQNGKVVLEWQKLSMYKLHQLLTLIIDNTKASKELVFKSAADEAVLEAIKFIDAWEAISLREVAHDPNTVTKLQSNAKKAFNSKAVRLHDHVKNPQYSKNIVHKLAMRLKDSIGCDSETRKKNQKVFIILQAAKVIPGNFPVEIIDMEYFEFIDAVVTLLRSGKDAYNMVMLFASDSHKTMLQLSEEEVEKRLTSYSQRRIPKADTFRDKTILNPKREPPVGSKRTIEGKPVNPGKQSSSDTTTKVVPPVVDCTVCGGKHSAETVKSYGDDYVCSFVHHKHPHVNLEKKPFLESTMGKPYKDHPWN